MGMKQEIKARPGFLHVEVRGSFSLAEAERTFLEMLEVIARHQVKKVLLDGRKLKGEPQVIERFYYGKFAAQSVKDFSDRGVSLATQFAYVLEVPIRDPQRFGETVAVNRGMYLKVCEDPKEALEWLGVAHPDTPDEGDR